MVTLAKTGNSEIDKQHSVMQDCLSDLASLLDGSRDPATLLGSLEALYSYTEWHFAFEERLLERNQYPNRVEHIAEHRAIIGQLNSLRRQLGAGNNDAVSLISVISQWIVDHVNNEDAKSAKHLGNSQVNTLHHDRRLAAESPLS
jgi:hemerythrin